MAYTNLKEKFVDGENIVKEWVTKEWDGIHATQHRIFFRNDSFLSKQTIEIPYSNIVSLESGKLRPLQRLYAALIPSFLLMVNYGMQNVFRYYPLSMNTSIGQTLMMLLILVALGLFGWFVIGEDGFTIHVLGREPINVSKELPELFSLARKNKR